MKWLLLCGLFVCSQASNISCRSKTNITHIEFCDVLDSVQDQVNETHGKITEASLNYIFNAADSSCWSDSTLIIFMKKDKFIQSELGKGYYSVDISFYNRSRNTEALLKSKNSRNLDYCQDDLVVEFEWVNGKLRDHPYHYRNGLMEGAEKIQLIDLKK